MKMHPRAFSSALRTNSSKQGYMLPCLNRLRAGRNQVSIKGDYFDEIFK